MRRSVDPVQGAGRKSDHSLVRARTVELAKIINNNTAPVGDRHRVQVYQSISPSRDHRSGRVTAPAAVASRLAGNHYHFDGSFNVGVQLHSHVKLTDIAQRAFWQAHFTFLQLNASGSHGISDVASTDGAKQLAFFTSVTGDGDAQFSQFGCTSFRIGRLLGSDPFQLGTAGFEGFDIFSSSW